MRWDYVEKEIYIPYYGDTKIVKRFLWWPKELENKVRWLETASYEREFVRFRGWVDKRWVDIICKKKG